MEKYLLDISVKFGLPGMVILGSIFYILNNEILNSNHIACLGGLLISSIFISMFTTIKSLHTTINEMRAAFTSTLSETANNVLELSKVVQVVKYQTRGILVEDSLKYHIPHWLSSIKIEVYRIIIMNYTLSTIKPILTSLVYDLINRTKSNLSEKLIVDKIYETVDMSIEKSKYVTDPISIMNIVDCEFEKLEKFMMELIRLD